jgi:hypothetical protein
MIDDFACASVCSRDLERLIFCGFAAYSAAQID